MSSIEDASRPTVHICPHAKFVANAESAVFLVFVVS
jgi:hypothetical protein